MGSEDVEKTETGVKKTGTWKEVTVFGEKVEEALKEAGISKSSIEEYSDWRPRLEEAEAEVKEKTLESATLEEKDVENETEGVKEDLGTASKKAAEAGKRVKKGENPAKEIAGASWRASLPLFSNIVRFFRKLEKYIYSTVIMRFNSFYLDTGELSVKVSGHRSDNYSMDVKVSDRQKQGHLRDSFDDDL